ncbi:MAG: XdhC family protein [Vicinamibacterales bacterium]
MDDFLDRVTALVRDGQSFATATVVARRPPVSAHLGDRAIVRADGQMDGFIGGACSREIVRRQALETLRLRHARLVSIRPDAPAADETDPEHVIVPMTCVSEGAVDVYVEPHLPRRRLVVVGATPVAEALARTAASLSYDVVRVVESDERGDLQTAGATIPGVRVDALEDLARVLQDATPETAVVVASQGHYDETALDVVLRHAPGYVGLVASRKRGASVRAFLEGNGIPGTDRVRCPAGLDLGARTAPEIALSILAEIVQVRPSRTLNPEASAPAAGGAHGAGQAAVPATLPGQAAVPAAVAATVPVVPVPDPPPSATDPTTAIDPVCGMTVDRARAKHRAEVDGVTYFFCCAGCRARFVAQPARYLAARS